MVGSVPTVNAAQAATMAIERMGTPAVDGRRDVRVPVNERAPARFPSVTDLRPKRGAHSSAWISRT
jgi:hypothetical protein